MNHESENAMKTNCRLLALLTLCLLAASCMFPALAPWLTDETKVAAPDLAGTWHDADIPCTVFFRPAETNGDYQVLMVNNLKDTSRFAASLHRVADHLLLAVGHENPEDLDTFTLLPSYFLFQAEVADDVLRLYGLNLQNFRDRALRAGLAVVPRGAQGNDEVLASPTEAIAAFVQDQLAEPDFFDTTPLYTFHKLTAQP